MISVELLLDSETEVAVLRDWRALITADLPSAGRHRGASNRPHITLAVREAPRSLDLSAAGSSLPLPVALGGIVVFPGARGRCVVARQVVVTEALLGLHRAVAAVVGLVDDPHHATTEPDRWTPHVTLARRMPVAALPEALAVVSAEPIAGLAAAMRIWDAGTRTLTDVG